MRRRPAGWHGMRGGSRRYRLCMCLLLAGMLLTARSHPSRATTSVWQLAPSSGAGPGPRSQYGMAADGAGHIYLYGGNAGVDAPIGDFWSYDVANGAWQQRANGVVPPLIEPHLAVDGQGNVWEFGGIANPGAPNLSADGHSYGLYEYLPTFGIWHDMTPADVDPNVNWPQGREDHGFAYDAQANQLVVFGGEGPDDAVLNDLWTYSLQDDTWTRVTQQYAGSGGQAIAPREIYNVSADAQGHLYLFGGSYLQPPAGAGTNAYTNDLWRYDDVTQTWTLLAGIANGYDPAQPLPRHYYGQTVDGAGNFDLIGGYLQEPASPPFFAQDAYVRYALPARFAGEQIAGTYGLSDFWQFNPATGWRDLSASLGALAGRPMIPYNMVFDALTDRLYTFGGYHPDASGTFVQVNTMWSASADGLGSAATPTATATTAAPDATRAMTATPASTMAPPPHVVAFPTATAVPATRTPATTQTAPGGTVQATRRAGPYALTLIIGPAEPIYTRAQMQRQHPRSGEVLLSGTAGAQGTAPRSATSTRSLSLYVTAASTGKPLSNVAIMVSISARAGAPAQRIPMVMLQGIGSGASDRHFGNNAVLPSGHYLVLVRIGHVSGTFDIPAQTDATRGAPARST